MKTFLAHMMVIGYLYLAPPSAAQSITTFSKVNVKAGEAARTYTWAQLMYTTGPVMFVPNDYNAYWIIEVEAPSSTRFDILSMRDTGFRFVDWNTPPEIPKVWSIDQGPGTSLYVLPASVGNIVPWPISGATSFSQIRIALSQHVASHKEIVSRSLGSGDHYITVARDAKGAFGDDVNAFRINAQSWLPILGPQATLQATRYAVDSKPDNTQNTLLLSARAVVSHSGNTTESIREIWWRDDVEIEPDNAGIKKLVVYKLSASVNFLRSWTYRARALAPDMRPDFVISSVRINNGKSLSPGGDTLSVDVTVKNIGSEYGATEGVSAVVPPFDNWFYGTSISELLAPGQSKKFSFSGVLNRPTGTHELRVKVDPDNRTEERDEDNNAFTALFKVRGPDFAITQIRLNPASPDPGQPFTAAVTIKNVGEESVNGVIYDYVRAWINRADAPSCADMSGSLSESWTSMAPGKSQTITFRNLTAPTVPGTYTFRAVVDGYCHIVEVDEENNHRSATYTVKGPDYVVSSIKLIPAKPLAGQPFDVEATIKNAGKGAAPAITQGHVYAWPDAPAPRSPGDGSGGQTSDSAILSIYMLKAGASQKLKFTGIPAPATPGAYTFRVYADLWETVPETNEDNNQLALTYNVYQGPDAPVLIAPAGEQTSATLTYTWNTAANATSYDVKIDHRSGPSASWRNWKSINGLKATSTAVSGHQNGYGYRWWAQARNSVGGAWSAPMEFSVTLPIVSGNVPGKPMGFKPNGVYDGVITTSTPEFCWSPGANTATIRLVVKRGSTTVIDKSGLTGFCYTPSTPLVDGTYTWYVAGVNSKGQGPWADPLSFVINTGTATLPGQPMGFKPNSTYDGTITTATPEFCWSPGAGTDTIRLVVKRGATTVIDQSSLTGFCFTAYTPLADGDYTWQVAGVNGAGQGPWSDVVSFTKASGDTGSLGVPVPLQPSGLQGSCYPTTQWSPVTGATGYQIMTDIYWLDTTWGQYTTTSNVGNVTSLPTGFFAADYRWKIRATNSASASDWSSWMYFTIPGNDNPWR